MNKCIRLLYYVYSVQYSFHIIFFALYIITFDNHQLFLPVYISFELFKHMFKGASISLNTGSGSDLNISCWPNDLLPGKVLHKVINCLLQIIQGARWAPPELPKTNRPEPIVKGGQIITFTTFSWGVSLVMYTLVSE